MSEFKVGDWVVFVSDGYRINTGTYGVIVKIDSDRSIAVSFPSMKGRLHTAGGSVNDDSAYWVCKNDIVKSEPEKNKKLIWSEPFALTLDNIKDVVDALKDGRGVETTYSHCLDEEFRKFSFGDDLFEEGDYYRIQIHHTPYEGEIEVNGRKIKVREVED